MCKRCRKDDRVRPDALGLPWCCRCKLPVPTPEEEALSPADIAAGLKP